MSKTATVDLRGIFPPITTPFENDEVNLRGLQHNLARYLASRVHGVVVLGSNGEAPHLSEEESTRIVAAAREQVPRGRRLIVGAGGESTHEAIASVKRLSQAGADVVLVRTPGYYKSQMTADAFIRHYTALADASPAPVLLYDAPPFTGVTLQVAAVTRLAAHPNIIGMKETAPDVGLVSEFVANTPSDFQVLVGSAPTLYASLCVGAVGGIVAAACVVPDLFVRLLTLVQDGQHEAALTLQRQLTPLARSVTAGYSIGGLKAALDLAGFVGGRPRSPLAPAPPEAVETMRAQLAALQALPV